MVQDQTSLKGKTIAVTRPCGQAGEEAQIIRRRGGDPYFFPTIEIKGLTELAPIKEFILKLAKGKFDYVVFMSVNGVEHLFMASETLVLSKELHAGLQKTYIIAVGPRTAEELKEHQIHVNLVPSKYTSEGIAESLQQFDLSNKKVAIPRTSAANPALKNRLAEAGALVEEVHVYESGLPANEEAKKAVLDGLMSRRIQAIVFGSGLCAKNFFEILNDLAPQKKLAEIMGKVTVVAIGPVTAKALAAMGVEADVVPERHTFEDALSALAQYWKPT
jgi:uroporphyrinogen-III synthase